MGRLRLLIQHLALAVIGLSAFGAGQAWAQSAHIGLALSARGGKIAAGTWTPPPQRSPFG